MILLWEARAAEFPALPRADFLLVREEAPPIFGVALHKPPEPATLLEGNSLTLQHGFFFEVF